MSKSIMELIWLMHSWQMALTKQTGEKSKNKAITLYGFFDI